MKRFVAIVAIVLAGCSNEPATPSYEELVKFKKSCTNQAAELKLLQHWQRAKNFAQDPDDLNEEDRKYNSQLKATIWWYAVECNNAKNTSPVVPD
jgi:hypothetical protein